MPALAAVCACAGVRAVLLIEMVSCRPKQAHMQAIICLLFTTPTCKQSYACFSPRPLTELSTYVML
jgi:hypothetical protein